MSKENIINFTGALVAFLVNVGINFFLSPYIVETVGVEAYGFVSLANQLIAYITIITVALNAMSNRFITVSLYRGDKKSANEYYASSFWANVLFVAIVLLPGILFVLFAEKLIEIPPGLISDVKALLLLLFVNFLVTLLITNLSVTYFVKNKLYISSMKTIIGNFLRGSLLLFAFALFAPHIWYIGAITLVVTLFYLCYNLYFKKKMMPEMTLGVRFFNFKKVKELLSSGIWQSVIQLSNTLYDGLDLLLANLFIGDTMMGILAVARTVPLAIMHMISNLSNIFTPKFTILYAQGERAQLIKEIKKATKVMSIMCSVPVAVLACCGDLFFLLWQPSQDASLLQALSFLTIAALVFTGSIDMMRNIFVITNKVKANSLMMLISSAISTGIVLILLKTTDLGVFAIAGVSTVIGILRSVFFTAPYSAKCLGEKWYVFYPEVFKTVLSFGIIAAVGYLARWLFPADSWIALIVLVAAICAIGVLIDLLVVLSKEERSWLWGMVKDKLHPILGRNEK